MFDKTSITLLKSAAKSDAAAQRAFALAQAAQTKADKARELAGVAEARERVVELSKIELAATLALTNASATNTAAIADRNTAWSTHEAAKKNEEVTTAALRKAKEIMAAAKKATAAERDLVKTTE